MDPFANPEYQMRQKLPLQVEENKRWDDCDPNNGNENYGNLRERIGKGHQARNLESERKRRRKLKDKLYSLRALVPKISKLDRAAILDDSINYIKDLQKQVNDVQIELEEHSDDASTVVRCSTTLHQNGTKTDPSKHENHDEVENKNKKIQQMEAQVEVLGINGSEFLVKVLCEHKPGGFVRLLEGMNSLGLQVINVNVSKHICLVSNILRVEKRESENMEADQVKESLVEIYGGKGE